jgi:DNA polymerase III delta subunit
MLTLLHGDNIEASRMEFIRLKQVATAKDIRDIDGRTIDDNTLTQALESHSLFGGDTAIFIENLFSKIGKKTKRIEALGVIINNSSESADIVCWEEKEIGTTVLKALKQVNAKLFKTPVLIFTFLDALAPGHSQTIVPLLQKLLQHEVPEIVYTMIVRRVRQLIQLADHITPMGLAPWQATRLTTQARAFTMEQLVDMHGKLLDIDIRIKTGASPFTMREHLEQFIINM